MATTLYSPLGAKVTVTDPARAAQLQARGWTLTAPTLPEPPDPPWGDGFEFPIIETAANADTFRFASIAIAEQSENEDTTSWPNRFEYLFRRFVGGVLQAARLVTWKNEYGEDRGIPAKSNTTVARWYVGEAAADVTARNANVPVIEVMNNRTDRITLFGIGKTGEVMKNIGTAAVPVWVRMTWVYAGTTNPGAGVAWLNTA